MSSLSPDEIAKFRDIIMNNFKLDEFEKFIVFLRENFATDELGKFMEFIMSDASSRINFDLSHDTNSPLCGADGENLQSIRSFIYQAFLIREAHYKYPTYFNDIIIAKMLLKANFETASFNDVCNVVNSMIDQSILQQIQEERETKGFYE